MDKLEINELLTDYRYRRHTIGLTEFKNISNTPTTLEGYGITDCYSKEEVDYKFLIQDGKIDSEKSGLATEDYYTLENGNNKYFKYTQANSKPKLELGFVKNKIEFYNDETNLYGDNISLTATQLITLDFNILNFQYGNSTLCSMYSTNTIFKIPVSAKNYNVLDDTTAKNGSLWGSTYTVGEEVQKGIHLTHEKDKYLILGYYNNASQVYNSYIILDNYEKLKGTDTDWAAIRFEKECLFRHNIKMGALTDIYVSGKDIGLNGRITSIEYALENGTYVDAEGNVTTTNVKWENVNGKPSTMSTTQLQKLWNEE